MTEVMTTVTNTDLTFDVPLDDDEAVEAWVDRLPRERVVEALYIANKMRKMFSQFEKMTESRILVDGLMGEGETWVAPDGQELMWGGDRKRVCASCSKPTTDGCEHMAELRDVLEAMPLSVLAKNALHFSFKPGMTRAYLTQLDSVAKFSEEAAAEIRSFVKYISTPPHLRSRDPKDR